jgi:hypothetical protein
LTIGFIECNALASRALSGECHAALLGLTGSGEPHGGFDTHNTEGSLHFRYYSASEAPHEHEKRIDDLPETGAGTVDSNEVFDRY